MNCDTQRSYASSGKGCDIASVRKRQSSGEASIGQVRITRPGLPYEPVLPTSRCNAPSNHGRAHVVGPPSVREETDARRREIFLKQLQLPQNRDHSVSDDLIVRFRSSIATGKSASNCGRDKCSKFSIGHVVANVVDTDGRFLRRLAVEPVGQLFDGSDVAGSGLFQMSPRNRALHQGCGPAPSCRSGDE